MKTLGYYNGTIAEIADMTVPMVDRACYFGDGVYDATCCGNYTIYNLQPHVDRFFRSAERMRIKIPCTREQLCTLLADLVRKMDTPNNFVYWQVTRGSGLRQHTFEDDIQPNLWVMIEPDDISDMQHEVYHLISLPDTRYLHCDVKTLNLLPSVLANQAAKEAGCQEAVLYREGERITECAHSNIHMLKNGVFHTAPLDNLILPGIARANLLRMCGKLGIAVDESPYTLSDLMQADEVILSSCTSFAMRVREIDGVAVGGKDEIRLHALQQALLDDFLQETHQKEGV